MEEIATLLTVLMFLSNLLPVKTFILTDSTGNYSLVPFIATLVNCCLWCKYGLLLHSNSIFVVNLVGLVVCFYSCYVYCKISSGEHLVRITGAVLLVVLGYVHLFYSSAVLQYLGLVSCLFSIAMFGAPLVSITHIVKVGTVQGALSLPMLILSLSVSGLWTLVGQKMQDYFVIIPNFIGFLLCLVQLFVYWKYSRNDYVGLPVSKIKMNPKNL